MGKIVKKAAKRTKAGSRPSNDTAKRSPGAERVRKHRAKMKAMGLRPVTLWLPDTNTPEFQAKIQRACEAINASRDSQIVLDGMWELTDFSDWNA